VGSPLWLELRQPSGDPSLFSHTENVIIAFRVSRRDCGEIEARDYIYEPTFILRGLTELNIEFARAG
jgi:hypothetical protein